MRPLPESSYAGLKTATRRLVAATDGIEAAASITRVGKSQIERYTSPHHPDFMPIDVVADLEAATGQPLVTEALARLAGCALHEVEPNASHPNPLIGIASLARHTGEVARDVAAALADRAISAAEARGIFADLDELESCARELRRTVETAALSVPEKR